MLHGGHPSKTDEAGVGMSFGCFGVCSTGDALAG